MRNIDVSLVEKIKGNIDALLQEQGRPESPYYGDATKLLVELHGPLVEMVDLDKEENTTFVDFLVALLYAKDRTHEESLSLLQDLSVALGKMRVDE